MVFFSVPFAEVLNILGRADIDWVIPEDGSGLRLDTIRIMTASGNKGTA